MGWMIAFWLWLVSAAGHRNFIHRVPALPGAVVLRFVQEEMACLRCLTGQGQGTETSTSNGRGRSLPCTDAPTAPPPPMIPVQSPIPEDYRSLYITFSGCYPIIKEDIMEFFNSVFGPCVEKVMVEKVTPGQHPAVYGRVVLRSAAMIPVVLGGQAIAKFLIKGRHIWARIYIPSSRLSYA